MITQIPNCMNGARTLKIHQDGAAPGRHRPISTTGGQTLIARCTRGYKRPTTEYNNKSSQTTLKVMQWNAEGLMRKKTELEHIMNKDNIDICCIQETHLQKDMTFKARGYQCFRTDRGGDRRKGGIITLIKSNINAYMSSSSNDGAEQHTITVNTLKRDIILVNYYCPNNVNLALHNIHVRDSNFIIMGDFNSHSQSWGYDHIDARGEEIEAWQDDKNLALINQPYDTPTFYSRCWHTTSTPDIALCTEDLHSITMRKVGDQLGGSDHRPAYLTLEARTVQASTLPRWNYKKANWSLYRHRTSILTNSIQVYDRDINIVIKEFNNYVLQAAKECIPKGARKDYKPYWNEDLNNKHNELTTARNLADVAPSIENNTALKQANAKFIKTRNEARRSSWMKKTASLNMETDSNKLWRLTKQLNDEENRHDKITLLQDRKMVHGKQAANIFADTYKEASNIPVELHKQKYVRTEQRKITESDDVSTVMNSPLSYEELTSALSNLKLKKSPGPDAITNEMIVNLGQPALHKLLDIFNKTWQEGTLPQIWREATMIPIHKKR